MAVQARHIRCLLVPIRGATLIVPNVAVAEVVRYQAAQPIPGSPEWLLGLYAWREKHIPVVSFEAAQGGTREEIGRQTRIAVFNTITPGSEMDFYAVLTDGFPHLMQLSPEHITPEESPASDSPLVQRQVQVAGTRALIPDLEGIERMLRVSGTPGR